ncbi:hypothetical protein GCM10010910_07940 [Microbacterium nanhaiense]|uniref:Uncharacterized protein n=1 Tax=Microbacterium nanhaiense TaxID=1301026 RepID=A0ABQ2MYE0_9MICO|nr:hypothetical protein [Microbacterium nanhaiense]GGO61050.1 hypothetical protein GCM10010910_07940 [Microbacterium nanhaiense]
MRRDQIVIGPAVSGVVLRAAAVAVAAGAAAALQPAPFWQVTLVLVAVAGAVLPRSGMAWVALLVLPVALLAGEVSPWRTAVAIAAVHALHVLASLALAIPARSRVALAALRPTAARWLGVQLVSQLVAAAVLVMPRAVGAGIAWAAPVGALAVALLAIILLRRAR